MKNHEFKSKEEEQFAFWLSECENFGLVEVWDYEPITFELLPEKKYKEEVVLKTKTKIVERTLHQSTTYTPDFRVLFTDKGLDVFKDTFKKSIYTLNNSKVVFFDTKGGFSKFDDGRHYSLLQKLTFEVVGVWVERVVPYKLFKKTFAPANVMWMKSRRKPTKTKIGRDSKTILEFLGNDNENTRD